MESNSLGLNELLILINAAVAVVFEWVPPIKTRWDVLEAWQKRLVIVGLAVVSAVTIFLVDCLPLGGAVCLERAGSFVSGIIVALMASQGTHRAIKRD